MSVPAPKFYDEHPALESLREAVLSGLARQPKALAPKFFYDARGSALFDAICQTPEYYPTRTEHAILERFAGEIADCVGDETVWIEPGSGNSAKMRLLLDAVRPLAYVPMDICRDYVLREAHRLAAEYPWLQVQAACADFTQLAALPHLPKGRRRVVFFPGSTIGNLEPAEARAFLGRIRELVGPGGGLLIGVDLKKDPDILNAAYNDAEGVTAAFNLNLLHRINGELGGDFDVDAFVHWAGYNPEHGRVEMHLVSRCEQTVHIAERRFEFARNESIHTENSYKYDLDEFRELAAAARLHPAALWHDPERLFSVQYFEAR